MGNIKISALPPKGSALTASDKIPIISVSTDSPTGYDTYSVTGNEVVGVINSTNFLYSQTEDGAVITNTVDELSLVGMGVGSLVVPANTFTEGNSYHLKLSGQLSALHHQRIDIRVYANDVILARITNVDLPPITSQTFYIEFDFTIRRIGGEGTASVALSGGLHYTEDTHALLNGVLFTSVESFLFNTEIDNTLDITAQWATADLGNSITTQLFNLRRTY